jgi:hypothetical protein
MQDVFQQAINEAFKSQKKLSNIQKQTVGLINELKTRSKNYMEQVANIEDGLEEDPTETEAQIQENIEKLTANIKVFNREIGERSNRFGEELQKMIHQIEQALELYEGRSGELSSLLKCRRSLLFFDIFVRKFKSKIQSLQLMNNALFAFSQEMKGVKEAYRSNLINGSTLMTHALEECESIIHRIEEVE